MDGKLMQGHTSKGLTIPCTVIFDSSICREWNDELGAMLEEFKCTSIAQANGYIENNLQNWVVEVCSINS